MTKRRLEGLENALLGLEEAEDALREAVHRVRVEIGNLVFDESMSRLPDEGTQ